MAFPNTIKIRYLINRNIIARNDVSCIYLDISQVNIATRNAIMTIS